MSNALQFLANYFDAPLVIFDDIESLGSLRERVPAWWCEVMSVSGEDRVNRTLDEWRGHSDQLPAVFVFLVNHLQKVSIFASNDSLWLLYDLSIDGRTMYYGGGNPRERIVSQSVQAVWGKCPVEFQRFYDTFHNGWCYLSSLSMGPAPVEDMFVLSELEWGILDNITFPEADLDSLLAVYTNGMGGYVTLNVNENSVSGDVLWWHDRPPQTNIDAWAVIDAWTEIGFEV